MLSTTTMIFWILIAFVSLANLGCAIFILIKMYQEKGIGHAILGFIFTPYGYIWGWMKARELDMRDIMVFWTAMILGICLLPFAMTFAIGGSLLNTMSQQPDNFVIQQDDGEMNFDFESSSKSGTINVGEQKTDQITDLFEIHNWSFQGNDGQQVTIRATAVSGADTDPRIKLLGPNGALLIEDDDGGGGTAALINGYSLPGDGTYTISVDVWTTGGYTLSLD